MPACVTGTGVTGARALRRVPCLGACSSEWGRVGGEAEVGAPFSAAREKAGRVAHPAAAAFAEPVGVGLVADADRDERSCRNEVVLLERSVLVGAHVVAGAEPSTFGAPVTAVHRADPPRFTTPARWQVRGLAWS